MTPVLPATVPIHAFVHRVLQVFRVQVRGCSLLLVVLNMFTQRLEACTFSSLQVDVYLSALGRIMWRVDLAGSGVGSGAGAGASMFPVAFIADSMFIGSCQEPISRSMQLYYISVTAFSYTDLFLDRIPLE